MVELEGNLVLHWIIVALGSLCPRKKPLITTTTIINNLIASQGAEKKHQLKGFLHDFLRKTGEGKVNVGDGGGLAHVALARGDNSDTGDGAKELGLAVPLEGGGGVWLLIFCWLFPFLFWFCAR